MTDHRLSDAELIRSFRRHTGPGAAGFVFDFLGTRTRTAFISHLKDTHDGRVEDYPIPTNFHATALEWAGTLRAVAGAAGRFVIVEVGAGWGPWLVSAAFAAQQRGIRDLALVGIEGSRHHYEFLQAHLRDNGLRPEDHVLLHGVVGTADGFAEFPELPDPAADYGQPARFAAAPPVPWRQRVKQVLKRLLGRPPAPLTPTGVARVRSYSLATLLQPYDAVDLVHIDIQGHEAEVVAAAGEVLARKVKWLVIGTHGRAIEQALMEELAARGWAPEGEEACTYQHIGRQMVLIRDGCQVWRNPRLAQASRQPAAA